MSKYLDLSIKDINNLLKAKKIKVSDLVNEAIERIESSNLNSFITLCKEEAIKRALELDEMEVDNILFGIPIALKDNIVTKNIKTTAGSKMLDNFIPVYDADVVELINDANMVIIGKTNMDEFAMGSSNQTSFYGPVKNPWDNKLVSGGSSGGSASSVSERLIPLTLGSDTGGSIRQPSSFCGVVGLKPTYGRVSRYGLIAFASSLDQIGPISRNVYENALLLNVICKKSKKDLTSIETNEDFTRLIGEDIKGLRIAIPNFYVSKEVNGDVLDSFNKIVELLKTNGALIEYVDIDYIDKAIPLYQIIALGEASSNLARYDGIRYGYSYDNPKNIDELYFKTRRYGFGEEVKRRIMVGSSLLSGENAKIYYNKALQIRNEMRKSFKETFKKYDLIIGPTTTSVAYDINSSLDDPNKSFIDDILTIPVNMAGLPGASIPIGFSDNLPVGMQIIADSNNEAIIYKLASYIEKELSLNLTCGGDNNE